MSKSDLEVYEVNGLRVIFKPKDCNTVYIGFKTGVGSANENGPDFYGNAHFLEHMMFKGTEKRNKYDITMEMGKLGNANAYTSFDETCYYITTLPENLKPATDLLFDIFFNSTFPKNELEKETNVILEELQSSEDDPGGFFYYRLMEDTFGDRGHPILGTKESIKATTSEKMKAFCNEHYHAGNVTLMVTGPITRKQLDKVLLKQDFTLRSGKKFKFPDLKMNKKKFNANHAAKQSLLTLTFGGIDRKTSYKRNLVDSLFRTCLGGGFGSVLVNRIREDLGLCYSINAFEWKIAQNSMNMIATNMDKKNIPLASREISKILRKIKKDGFDEKTQEFAKSYLKYKIIGSGDSASGEVSSTLSMYDEWGKVTKKELLSKINALTNKDLIEFGQEYFVVPKIGILNEEKSIDEVGD